jgi:hypothetical protein
MLNAKEVKLEGSPGGLPMTIRRRYVQHGLMAPSANHWVI